MSDSLNVPDKDANEFEQILAEYLRIVDSGQDVEQEEFVRRHPQWERELREYFADSDALEGLFTDEQQEGSAASPTLLDTIRYLGDYELIDEIGRGAMGVVYRARQVTLDRIVAVKVQLIGRLAGDSDRQRFRAEAQNVAALNHPGIIRILEVGEHEQQQYFSMEYVTGRNLAAVIRETNLPFEKTARYVQRIAEAIAYAHEKGILHRDIKPSNVLVDENDRIIVTDFGLAKRVECESDLTGSSDIIGTPNYMSPEQATARHAEIGPASDIFSLGAVLYEALTGRPPFYADTPLSTLLQAIEGHIVPPRLLNPSIPKDLETICLKCMRENPSRRYGSSEELADDLGRFLTCVPIQARPVSRLERVLRWCYRMPLATTLILMLAIIAVVSPLVAIHQLQLRRDAVIARDYATEAEELAQDEARKAKIAAAREATARKESQRTLSRLRQMHYLHAMNLAQVKLERGELGQVDSLLRSQIPASDELDYRGFEWFHFWNRSHDYAFQTTHEARSTRAVLSKDGRLLVVCGGRVTRVWNLHDQTVVAEILTASEPASLPAITSERDVLAVESNPGQINLYRASTAELLHTIVVPHSVFVGKCFAFSPNGLSFAAAGRDINETQSRSVCSLGIWDVATGGQICNLKGLDWDVGSLVWSPSGTMVAASSIRMKDAGNERGSIEHLWGFPSEIKIWDTDNGSLRTEIDAGLGLISSMDFSADERTLAACSASNTSSGAVRLWNVEDGDMHGELLLDSNAPGILQCTASGEIVVASYDAAMNAAISEWNPRTGLHSELRRLGQVLELTRTQDNRLLAVENRLPSSTRSESTTEDSTVTVWDLKKDTRLSLVDVESGRNHGLAFSPDGNRLAIWTSTSMTSTDGMITVWDLNNGEKEVISTSFPLFATFLPNGDFLWQDGARFVHVFEHASGTSRVWVCPEAESREWNRDPILAFSAKEAVFGVQSTRGHLALRYVADQSKSILVLEGSQIHSLCSGTFSPSGDLFATGSWVNHGEVHLWETATGRPLATWKDLPNATCVLEFSPNGELLALASHANGTWVQLRDVETGQLQMTLEGHKGTVTDVAFAPNGKTLAVAQTANAVKLWNVSTGVEVASLTSEAGTIHQLEFSPDGKVLAGINSGNGKAALWWAQFPNDTVSAESRKTDRRDRAISATGDSESARMLKGTKIEPLITATRPGSSDHTAKAWDRWEHSFLGVFMQPALEADSPAEAQSGVEKNDLGKLVSSLKEWVEHLEEETEEFGRVSSIRVCYALLILCCRERVITDPENTDYLLDLHLACSPLALLVDDPEIENFDDSTELSEIAEDICLTAGVGEELEVLFDHLAKAERHPAERLKELANTSFEDLTRACIRVNERLLEIEPNMGPYKVGLAVSQMSLGGKLRREKRLQEARDSFREVVEICVPLVNDSEMPIDYAERVDTILTYSYRKLAALPEDDTKPTD